MNVKSTIEKVAELSKLTVEQINDLVEDQISELKGLIDKEVAIIIVAKNLEVSLKFEKSEKLDIPEIHMKLFAMIADSRNLKGIIYDKAVKSSKGFIRQFRFGNEQKSEDIFIESGKNFAATIFILNIKKVELANGPITFVNALMFQDGSDEKIVVSLIPCKFCNVLGDLDSINSVFRLEYSEKMQIDENSTEHIGKLEFVKKFKRTKQSKL